jgi:hypothetical protein
MLVLFGCFEVLVISSVVLDDVKLHFHLDEAEETFGPWESLGVF